MTIQFMKRIYHKHWTAGKKILNILKGPLITCTYYFNIYPAFIYIYFVSFSTKLAVISTEAQKLSYTTAQTKTTTHELTGT